MATLSIGGELLDLQKLITVEDDGWGGIWDTNRPSLQAALEGFGYQVLDLGIVSHRYPSNFRALGEVNLLIIVEYYLASTRMSAL